MSTRQHTVDRDRRLLPGRPDKHAAILKAAAELFARQGFSATSMHEIALKAGVARQTVYNHFSAKDEVFRALAGAFADRVTGSFPEPATTSDLRGNLIELAMRMRSLLLAPGSVALHRVLIWEAPHFPELAKAVYEAGPGQLIVELAEQFRKNSSKRLLQAEAMRAGEQFMSMVLGRSQLRALLGVSEAGDTSGEHVEETVDAFLKGWGLG